MKNEKQLQYGSRLVAAAPALHAEFVMLVFPGGGYAALTENEGQIVAEHFAKRGYAAYVLSYNLQSNGKMRMPELLEDVHEAVCILRKNHPGCRVFLTGFSAGANLLLNYGNAYGDVEGLVSGYGASQWSELAQILSTDSGNPLLNQRMAALRDAGFRSLFGTTEVTASMLEEVSPIFSVHPQTPPTFLWHCGADHLVPCHQSVEYFTKLTSCGVKAELHLFAGGEHGVGLAENTPASDWTELADRFLRTL